MRFTIGVRDVLVLRNEDDVAATFGPVRLKPPRGWERLQWRARHLMGS